MRHARKLRLLLKAAQRQLKDNGVYNMDLFEAIYARRSIRKFKQEKIKREELYDIIDCARLAPSAVNRQPIRYSVIDDENAVKEIFSMTKWAGYEPNAGPNAGEEPTAYIAVLGDGAVSETILQNDSGLAMGTLCIATAGKGLASCILGAIDRTGIAKVINMPDDMKLLYIVALGYPAQISRTSEMKNNDSKYYLEDGTLNVPKRPLNEAILNYTEEK